MAIQKTITLQNGLVATNAYVRVDTVSGYKGGIDYSVNSYLSKEAFESGQGYLEQEMLHFIPSVSDDASNFIRQAYDDLKTRDKYKDGIDC